MRVCVVYAWMYACMRAGVYGSVCACWRVSGTLFYLFYCVRAYIFCSSFSCGTRYHVNCAAGSLCAIKMLCAFDVEEETGIYAGNYVNECMLHWRCQWKGKIEKRFSRRRPRVRTGTHTHTPTHPQCTLMTCELYECRSSLNAPTKIIHAGKLFPTIRFKICVFNDHNKQYVTLGWLFSTNASTPLPIFVMFSGIGKMVDY